MSYETLPKFILSPMALAGSISVTDRQTDRPQYCNNSCNSRHHYASNNAAKQADIRHNNFFLLAYNANLTQHYNEKL